MREQSERETELVLKKRVRIMDRIGQLMNRFKISQKELAERVGVSESFISRMLRSDRDMTLRTIARLEIALGDAILVTPTEYERHLMDQPKRLERLLEKSKEHREGRMRTPAGRFATIDEISLGSLAGLGMDAASIQNRIVVAYNPSAGAEYRFSIQSTLPSGSKMASNHKAQSMRPLSVEENA